MTKHFQHIIIGGGISGLTAALELSKTSKSICVIEPGIPGGCIKSSKIKGFTLEHGATTLVLTPAVKTLLTELELINLVSTPAITRHQQYVWHDGAPHQVPKGPGPLFKSSLFTLREKLRIISGMFKKFPHTSAQSYVTLSQLFGELLGISAVAKTLNPALRGIYGGDVSKLSARHIFSKLSGHLLSGGTLFQYMKGAAKNPRTIFHLQGGNSIITETIVKKLSPGSVLQDSVQSLVREDCGTFLLTTTNGESLRADSVYIATSGGQTASYIEGLSKEASRVLHTIRYAPITVVHIAVPRSTKLLTDAFGILFPSNSDSKIIGALFNSQLFPHTAPSEFHLITVCIGGIDNPNPSSLLPEHAGATALSELNRLLGIGSGEVLAVHHWNHAIPQYEDTIEALHNEFERLERENPGLHFIGVDRGGVGIPDRIECAMEVVKRSEGLLTLQHRDGTQVHHRDIQLPKQAASQ